jgi:hypothetical protein
MAMAGFIHRRILPPLRHQAIPTALVSVWDGKLGVE